MDKNECTSLNCPMCMSIDVHSIHIPYRLFQHLNFEPILQKPGSLGRCNRCQLVFRVVGPDTQRNIDNLYKSAEYAELEMPKHTVTVDAYRKPVTVQFLQVELLSRFLPEQGGDILDIGCSDGRLLCEFHKRYEGASLCGFDVSARPKFPRTTDFRFVSGRLEDVSGWFDLIVMSHSVQYVRDMSYLFTQIFRLLKPGGTLFVQVPNFERKPCSLLLHDLYYHYTPNILNNVFQHWGLEFSVLDDRWFPGDILGVGHPKMKGAGGGYTEDFQVYQSLQRIERMTHQLVELSGEKTVGVLGTTTEAAFVHSTLGQRVAYFVDENPNKVGSLFQRKEVLHPRSVKQGEHVIIPMGSSGEKIKHRLAELYQGTYICV